ncbi:MAG: peroxidase [Acidobacteria bacterium]|nr:peroxidase [Acidobacteriota bacterium]
MAEALAEDHRRAPISDAEKAMLDYALKLTREPWAMERSDVEALKAVGWDDTAVLDIAQVTAYYAYVNRLADGLGVELEDFWEETT